MRTYIEEIRRITLGQTYNPKQGYTLIHTIKGHEIIGQK